MAPARPASPNAVASIGAVLVLFLVGKWDLGPLSPTVGRFFPNLYFLGAVLVALQLSLCWRSWPRWARYIVLIYASLFAVSGATSRPDLWLGDHPAPSPLRSQALAPISRREVSTTAMVRSGEQMP
jgi:hypothetical protein